MGLMLLVIAANVVAGALLYLDVVRNGRSGWWLLAFWVFGPLALVAYLVHRRRPRDPAPRADGGHMLPR